jgi:hypothetical protein
MYGHLKPILDLCNHCSLSIRYPALSLIELSEQNGTMSHRQYPVYSGVEMKRSETIENKETGKDLIMKSKEDRGSALNVCRVCVTKRNARLRRI